MPRRLRVAFPGAFKLSTGGTPAQFNVTGNAATFATTSNLSDFDTRKNTPGVVRWFDFDSAQQLGGDVNANFGRLGGRPVIDTAVKASGAGSIRFDVASQTTDDTHAWFTNFTSDLQQFGAGDTFFVQWRQRFNQAFIDTVILDSAGNPQGGIKQAITGAGSVGTDGHGTSTYATSCSENELTVQTFAQNRFPIVYNQCGVYAGLYETINGGLDFGLQNEMPSPFCRFSSGAGCFRWVADEWMTWQMQVTLGPIVSGKYTNCTVKFWGAREGQPSQLLIDFNPSVPGYFNLNAVDVTAPGGIVEYGKIWFTPFMTDKSLTQTHALLQTWYDELIIGTQRIPDPAPVITTNPTLALGVNQGVNLTVFNPTAPLGDSTGQTTHITDYSGMQYDAARHRMVIQGGGHASTNADQIVVFPLATGGLTWSNLYQPTPLAMWTSANYDQPNGRWLSGGATGSGPYPRAVARHTLDLNVVVGDQFVVLAFVEGNYGNLQGDWSSEPGYNPGDNTHWADSPNSKIAHYHFISGTWSWAAIDKGGRPGYFPAAAYDPISQKIIILGEGMCLAYNPVTKTIETVFDWLTSGNPFRNESGSIVSAVDLGGNQNLIYFPPEQCMYYFHEAGSMWRVALPAGRTNASSLTSTTVTRMTTTGSVPVPTECGMAYDSVNQLIGLGPFNSVFYTYSPIAQPAQGRAAKSWQNQLIPGNPGTLNFHCIDYNPVDNCYIFITSEPFFRTWAYRYR